MLKVEERKLESYRVERLESSNFKITVRFRDVKPLDIILLKYEVKIMLVSPKSSSVWYHEFNYMINIYEGNRINFIDLINGNIYHTAKIDYNQFISDVRKVYDETETMIERKPRYYYLSPTIKLNIAESARERLLSRLDNNSLVNALKSLTRVAKNYSKGRDDQILVNIYPDHHVPSFYFEISRSNAILLNGGMINHSNTYQIHT